MNHHDKDVVVLEEDLVPDEQPNTVPTAILEEDDDPTPRGMALQTIAMGVGVFISILLVLLLASGGQINFFRVFGIGDDSNPSNTPMEPRLGTSGANNPNGASGGSVAAPGSIPDYIAQIDPVFRSYWETNGGLEIFGRPISGMLEQNGRQVQWFERARLEAWPEHAGTKYAIQPGRVGVEFTEGRQFPTQEFFVNRPGLQYSEVTRHGIRGAFLDYWLKHGGVDAFGYPISDELQEILPEDGAYHTVQYFERARFELHPNTPQLVMLGRLGDALYKQGLKPNIVPPVKPTPVPITP